MTFVDPERPELGLLFDGRVAEDFKLDSGTWVSVGTFRVAGIAALAPLAQDIVVTIHAVGLSLASSTFLHKPVGAVFSAKSHGAHECSSQHERENA